MYIDNHSVSIFCTLVMERPGILDTKYLALRQERDCGNMDDSSNSFAVRTAHLQQRIRKAQASLSKDKNTE